MKAQDFAVNTIDFAMKNKTNDFAMKTVDYETKPMGFAVNPPASSGLHPEFIRSSSEVIRSSSGVAVPTRT